MLDAAQRETAADLLWAAERDRAPIDPLTKTHPGIDVVDAYEIQLINIHRRLAGGARLRGHKVAPSSPVTQLMMGVDEPDYGHLLDTMLLPHNVPIQADRYCHPRIEVEIGYLLGSSLTGEGCTREDVLAATEYIVPSLGLIDSRVRDWRIGPADAVADNASSAGVVLGEIWLTPGELADTGIDLANIDAVLVVADPEDGQEIVIAKGNTRVVLGDPTTAVAWLAAKVAPFGVRLEAGHLVLPGSCTRAVDIHAGDTFRAEFAGLGSVTASFE